LITDALDWRWLFFVNVLPGLAIATACAMLLRIDKADTSLLRRIDWAHFVAMAVFLAGLEYVLEEGPRHDWLGDETIAIAAWLSLVGLVLFVERAVLADAGGFAAPVPPADLRLRLPVQPGDRLWHVCLDLAGAGLSGASARVRCPADRQDDLRGRRGATGVDGRRRVAVAAHRHALDDQRRPSRSR
jgi:MFS family permease